MKLKNKVWVVIVILAILCIVGFVFRTKTITNKSPIVKAFQTQEINVAGTATTTIGALIGNGTAGSVLFVDGSGNLGQSNSNLFWDNSNNRLGIGTSTPAQSLAIGNNFSVTSLGNVTGFSFTTGSTVTSYQSVTNRPLVGPSFYNLTGLWLSATTSASVPQLILATSGNIGIGTTTPSVQFQIVNSTATTTIAIGSSYTGSNVGKLCEWNGSNFTITSFSSNSITPIYATSSTCQ
jgi:hypothetical protein